MVSFLSLWTAKQGRVLLPGAARAVGWKGKTGFAGNRLHGTERKREWRKVGGSLFGGEKGEALGPL
ncbi:hypothetical protein EBB04_32650 [Sinorhizobium meliloti]|nr:hypothetical protein EBB04_32650 [Sinorhizobium meliloti]